MAETSANTVGYVDGFSLFCPTSYLTDSSFRTSKAEQEDCCPRVQGDVEEMQSEPGYVSDVGHLSPLPH